MSKRTLVVFGATGNQGSSVIHTILSHPTLSQKYTIRGVTRNPSSEKAQALVATYPTLTLVTGDLNIPSTLRAALKDAYAVFGVTNFWESCSRTTETQQGKNIADAAFATPGLRHLIWSSLPNVAEVSGGRLTHAAHFDGKHDVQVYIDAISQRMQDIGFNHVSDEVARHQHEQARPAITYFQPGFYMSNAVLEPRGGAIAVPWDEKTMIPLFDAVRDTGVFVAGILEKGPIEMDGKIVRGVSEWLNVRDAVDIIGAVRGEAVELTSLPIDLWKTFLPEAIREELADTMALVQDYSYYGKGTEKRQAESDAVVESVEGLQKSSFRQYLQTSQK